MPNIAQLSPLVPLVILLFTGCGLSDEEKQALDHVENHYEGEFKVVDRTTRGARTWVILEHEGRAFKIATSSIPPHQVVEDRFPDLMVARKLESRIEKSWNPVADVTLTKVDRETVRDLGPSSDVVPEDLTLFIARIGTPSEFDEEIIKNTVARVSAHLPLEFRWQASLYRSDADPTTLRYRPVVPLAWMQQSAENLPQSQKIQKQFRGVARGDDVTVTLR